MQTKKSNKANLERKRGIHFITGILISLSLVLISFEWTRPLDVRKSIPASSEIEIVEQMIITKRPEKTIPPEKAELPPIAEVLLLTEEPVLEDFVPTWEPGPDPISIYHFPTDEPEIIEEKDPFIIVEDMPTFQGLPAEIGFPRYIAEHLVYPEEAIINGVDGKVYVRFVINESGQLVDATIYSGVHPVLDKEALRVVNSSPAWSPGKQRGRKVSVQFTFPINFILQ